jgi:MFS family permease
MKASDAALETPAALAPAADRAYITRIVLLFCFGWGMVYLDRTVLYPLIPVVKRELGLTATQAGWITGLYFLMYAPMHGIGGIIGDWLGIKRVLVIFTTLAGVGLVLLGLAPTYSLLLLAVAVHGLGVGCYYVGAYGTTMHTVPGPLRGIASGIINGGMSLGLVAGLISADWLFRWTGSWQRPFLILAVPTLAAAAMYQTVIRPVPRQGFSLRGVGAFFRDRQLLCLGLAGFTVVYGYFVILSWGPTFFQAERGFGILKSGVYTAMIAVAALPAGITAGRLSDRLGRKRLSLTLLPLGALCLFALPLVRSQGMLFLMLVCYGLVGKLAWDPIMFAWLGDRVTATHPTMMGGTMGLFGCVIMMGAFVAPLVTGWIRDLTGSLTGGFYVGGALVLVGALLLLVPQETVRR